jgi:hypothetical protein
MSVPAGPRRALLSLHVVVSVGWIGALAAYLALAAAGLVARDPQTVRAAYLAGDLVTSSVIVPLALAALATGVVQGLATPWGLIRHFWVLFKLVMVAAATALLLVKAGPIAGLAAAAAEGSLSGADLRGLRISVLGHALGGLVVLLWATLLGLYKPQGLTPYGWRRHQQDRP